MIQSVLQTKSQPLPLLKFFIIPIAGYISIYFYFLNINYALALFTLGSNNIAF